MSATVASQCWPGGEAVISRLLRPRDPRRLNWNIPNLVGKCSATCCTVAAPPPGARHGLGGPMHPRHPLRWQRERCDRGLWGAGGVAATPLLHTQNCGMSCDTGVATPWSATGGGVASAPLRNFQSHSFPEDVFSTN